MFRQTALEYLRLHPDFIIQQSWRERWRLMVLAAAFARGRGRLPHIHACFPNTFEGLEEPLGHLAGAVLRLDAYFEAAAASKRYAVLSRRGWPLLESSGRWPSPMPSHVAVAAELRPADAAGGGRVQSGGGPGPR